MYELQTFSNAELGSVRTVTIDSKPYFVGKDVAEILGYSNTRDALAKRVDDEDKFDGVAICDSIGREQKPVLINEQKLVKSVKQTGGICPKFVSPGFDGMPDRLVLLPFGKIAFVEVKAPNKKPRPLQRARYKMLKRLGFKVYVLDDEEQIGEIIDEIQTA